MLVCQSNRVKTNRSRCCPSSHHRHPQDRRPVGQNRLAETEAEANLQHGEGQVNACGSILGCRCVLEAEGKLPPSPPTRMATGDQAIFPSVG